MVDREMLRDLSVWMGVLVKQLAMMTAEYSARLDSLVVVERRATRAARESGAKMRWVGAFSDLQMALRDLAVASVTRMSGDRRFWMSWGVAL